ncbi:MAG: M3 family oligoendopeptidase [Candidatus Dormibacteria bacterium]
MTIATLPTTGAENIHWDLSHLYPGLSRSAVVADLGRADELARTFDSTYRGRVKSLDGAGMKAALAELEEVHLVLEKAAAYSFLDFSTDVSDQARQSLLQQVQESLTQTSTMLLFFNLEWLEVDDEAASKLLEDPALASYRHHLESSRKYKPYVLSEPEERILSEKSVTARGAWDRLFDEACAAIRVDTEAGQVNLEEALSRLRSGDRAERREIQQGITDGLRSDVNTRRFILNTILADKAIDDRLRRYPHWIADRNLANEAPDESVEALVGAVTSRYDIPHRFYGIKKRLLGLEVMYDYDRYAPVGGSEPDVSWDQARETVLDAYESFSPRLRDLAQEFFDNNWIDAATGPSKRGGAYAHPVTPAAHPYVFLNFTGKRRDVLVMAHELGHGVHMSLSRKQTVLNFQTPLTTAETASIFGETVTFSRMLERETDPERRLGLMIGRIDDAVATIFRQVAMNRFEDRIHTQRRQHGELSEDDLAMHWLETQGAMLGSSIECTENYGAWWSYISHFIGVPGYVYAYSFGNLLALAVYEVGLKEGPGFAPRYFEMLAAGGSRSPQDLTREIGVDLSDPGFWAGGLRQISDLVDEAEALSKEVTAT